MCPESVPAREASIIGDTNKSVASAGDMKRVTRLTDGAIKTTFRESDAGLLSSCGAVDALCACLMLVAKASSSTL